MQKLTDDGASFKDFGFGRNTKYARGNNFKYYADAQFIQHQYGTDFSDFTIVNNIPVN